MLRKPPCNIRSHRGRIPSVSIRHPHKRILVIYTGKITEKDILQDLKNSLPNGVLNLQYQKNIADALSLARNAIVNAERDDQFDAIFIISDVDNLSTETLVRQRAEAATLKVPTSILLSKPCIEVWIACYATETPRDKISTIKTAQRFVAARGLTYGRDNKQVRTELLRNHKNAVKVAKRLNACCGTPPNFVTDAPTTEFYKLHEFLKDEFQSL